MRNRPVVLFLFALSLAAGGCGGSGGPGAGPILPPGTELADLTTSIGTLSPAFAPGTLAYTAGPGLLDGSVKLTPTAADPGATIKVDGNGTLSGTASVPIPLAVGATPVTVLVTAADGVTQRSYVVVFLRQGPVGQEAYVKASNTGSPDHFGSGIALSGDTLVVGARHEASRATGVNGDQLDDGAAFAGAAYVFVRSGSTWVQQAYLKASNTDADDRFGWSVAISGDTIVVGALLEDSAATGIDGNGADNGAADSGAAYVFVRNGATWSQQAYLKASNTDAGDQFGWSVDVAGETIVVGALHESSHATGVDGDQSSDTFLDSGAAYVFVRAGTTWSQQAYVKASNTASRDYFGTTVALSGDTLVVGASHEDSAATGVNGNQADNGALDSGAAYVFVRSGTTWTQQAYLKPSNTDAGDEFGNRVAVSSDTLVVGARMEASSATGVGGDPTDNSAPMSGAAYVFVRSGTTWSQQAYLKASNSGASDLFGWSLDIAGDAIVVGASAESSSATGVNGDGSDNSAAESGAAYVFVRSGTTWSQQSYLKASNTEVIDGFGEAVAIAGDTVAVSAAREDSSATGVGGDQTSNGTPSAGAAYVYR